MKGFDLKILKVAALVGAGVLMNQTAWAAPRVFTEGPIVVKAAVGKAVKIEMEAGVADLVRSGDPMSIKVEHTSGHLFVTPLSLTPAELTVIDTRGHSHHIRYVFGDGVDDKVVVCDNPDAGGAAAQEDGAMALMRDLIRGRVSERATEQRSEVVMLDNGRVRVQGVVIHELPRMRGYTAVVENLTRAPLVVPVQQITFPGLVAVASQKDMLAPGESCALYMVAGR